MKCIECGKPARLARGMDDIYSEHCSNECAVQTWERYRQAGSVVCVGNLTVAKIDEQLSTTGFDPEQVAPRENVELD